MNLEKYAQLAFFNGLATADVRLLEPFFAPQSWVAGTLVFEQGDYADYLYLVARGEVTIRYRPDDGPAITVTRVQPGGIFGWSAAMGNPSYTCQAVCTLDSEVLRIRGAGSDGILVTADQIRSLRQGTPYYWKLSASNQYGRVESIAPYKQFMIDPAAHGLKRL